MLSADRVERNQQAAPQHIPLEWHTDFGGEEMAEASERQVALPGRVGKPDGACLDEPINRLRGSHDARIERSARFKCEPSLPEARSEEHTSELQSLMRISYAVFCLKKKQQ